MWRILSLSGPFLLLGSCLSLARRTLLSCLDLGLRLLEENAPSDRSKVLCRRNDQRRKKVDQIGSSAIDLKTLSIFFLSVKVSFINYPKNVS